MPDSSQELTKLKRLSARIGADPALVQAAGERREAVPARLVLDLHQGEAVRGAPDAVEAAPEGLIQPLEPTAQAGLGGLELLVGEHRARHDLGEPLSEGSVDLRDLERRLHLWELEGRERLLGAGEVASLLG